MTTSLLRWRPHQPNNQPHQPHRANQLHQPESESKVETDSDSDSGAEAEAEKDPESDMSSRTLNSIVFKDGVAGFLTTSGGFW